MRIFMFFNFFEMIFNFFLRCGRQNLVADVRMELRGIENCKIACAEKLFEQFSTSDVKYAKIDGFGTLMALVK